MPRRCERPGCSLPADVAYGFDPGQSTIWIEAVTLAEAEAVNAGVLCRRHADALRPPIGWYLDDRREAVPRLFRSPEADDPAAESPARARPRKERSARAVDTTDELPFPAAIGAGADIASGTAAGDATGAGSDDGSAAAGDDDTLVAATHVAATAIDPDETEALPWTPVFDQTDDLDGLLDARGPLLSRAFGRRAGPDAPAAGAR